MSAGRLYHCQGTGRKSGELASGDGTGCPGEGAAEAPDRLPASYSCALCFWVEEQRMWVLLSRRHGRLHRERDKFIVTFLSLTFVGIAAGGLVGAEPILAEHMAS